MSAEQLADSDWSKRTTAISFRRLIHLDSSDSETDTFTSTSSAYPPTSFTRTYGGHTIAQAAWAAAHTIPHGLHIHSVTGYFLAIGDARYAFKYRVRRVRDGGVYALRTVEAFQDGVPGSERAPMFICIVSFKRDESHTHQPRHKKRRYDFEHQQLGKDWLEQEYGHILRKKKRFEDWPHCQGMDALWAKDAMSIADWKVRGEVFPGLEMRKVDMTGYNGVPCQGGLEDQGDVARRWRLLILYKLIKEDGERDDDKTVQQQKQQRPKSKQSGADDDLNLYACAHIYSSDRNGLFMIQRALGLADKTGQMGSLSHTVNFHGRAEDLQMLESDGSAKEFVQESWASNSGDDRVCHESRIWDRKKGKIIASTVQDGMMRMLFEQLYEVLDGEVTLKREAKL